MANPAANGRTPAGVAALKIESARRASAQEAEGTGLLAFTSQLSRKLSWAIATSWEASTGTKLPRGGLNDIVEAHTVQIALQLSQQFPLFLGPPTPPPPIAPSADGA